MNSRTAVLAAALTLLAPRAPAAAAPPGPSDLDSLRAQYRAALRWDRYWDGVKDADRFASIAGISDSERAGLLVEGARARALVGDGEGVQRDLKEALRLEPGDAEASYRLAAADRENPREALRYAEQAARAARTDLRRAAAYRLAGEIRLDLGDKAGARDSLRRALKLSGDDLESLQIMVRIARSRPREAAVFARRADRAAEKAPLWARPAADCLGARIWLEFNDFPNAVAAFKRALALEPDNLYALEGLVRIRREQPRFPVTLEGIPAPGRRSAGTEGALQDAVRINPGDLAALGELVELARERKKLPEELAFAELFMDAVLDAPRWMQPPAYRFITEAWIDGGDEAKISQSLGLAKDLDRRSLEIERLTVRIRRHDFRAETEDPRNLAVALVEIARARAELGDVAGARQRLAQALEVFPGDAEALQFSAELAAGAQSPGPSADSGTR